MLKGFASQCRNPRDYFAIMDAIELREADGRFSHWELISCKCVDTYVRLKKNQNQICWKWRKVMLGRLAAQLCVVVEAAHRMMAFA